jgi:hypothetical protein
MGGPEHVADDVGWLINLDQYFVREVYYIISTVMTQLEQNPDRKFMCKKRTRPPSPPLPRTAGMTHVWMCSDVEVGFFERW